MIDKMDALLGSKIKAARQECGFTQGELAKKIGITQSQLSAFEKGRVRPTNGQMLTIVQALDCDLLLLHYKNTSDIHIYLKKKYNLGKPFGDRQPLGGLPSVALQTAGEIKNLAEAVTANEMIDIPEQINNLKIQTERLAVIANLMSEIIDNMAVVAIVKGEV